MSDVARGLARISDENAAATRAAVEPHLEPGEEVRAVVPVRPVGGKLSTLWGPRIQMTPAPVELPKAAVVAVTPHRVLIVSYPHQYGTDEEVSTLLHTRALEDVRS